MPDIHKACRNRSGSEMLSTRNARLKTKGSYMRTSFWVPRSTMQAHSITIGKALASSHSRAAGRSQPRAMAVSRPAPYTVITVRQASTTPKSSRRMNQSLIRNRFQISRPMTPPRTSQRSRAGPSSCS